MPLNPQPPSPPKPVHDIVEQLLTKASRPRSPPIEIVDLEQLDDEDEITIVAQNIVSSVSNDIQIVSDNISSRHHNHSPSSSRPVHADPTAPVVIEPPNLSSSIVSSEADEVLICHPVASTSRASTTSSCQGCNKPLSHRVSLSRCKHILCQSCCFLAVVYVENPSDKPLIARHLQALPVCRAPRCAAPLSRPEVVNALAAPICDTAFNHAFSIFQQWQKTASNHPVVGPANVVFPPYDPHPAPPVVHDPTNPDDQNTLRETNSYPDPLVTDDFHATFAPLWVWDEEHPVTSNQCGAWLCAACGEYDTAPGQPLLPDPSDSPVTPGEAPNTVPDAPAYPHCAYARSLALIEYVRGLERSRDENIPTRKRRASPRVDDSTRKRYRSASSIRSDKRRRAGFAKGTGYAGRSGNEWQGISAKIMQKTARMDNEASYWLSRVRCVLLLTLDAPLTSWPGFMRLLIRECKLVPQLAAILINESIMDVQERVPLFVSALRVVHALVELSSLRMLVTEPIDGANGRNIAELVESLSRQAAFLTSGAGAENLPPCTALLVKQIRRCIRVINRHNLIQLAKIKALGDTPVNVDEDGSSPDDCNDIDSSGGATGVEEQGVPLQETSFESDKRVYLEQMKEHQFRAVPGLASRSSFKLEASQPVTHGAPQGNRQRRIAGEVASLFSSLPLSWSSSILLRVDEDRYDILRACIFGPEDTPYDSGAFIFDIFLPSEYPVVPPKFRLLTTGGGRVRFNPNLYSSGKVCLSLLGTWSGPSWNSGSTILQVLVSIQSLILVSSPYFNEPGFESQMNTAEGKGRSDSYNNRVRYDNAFHAIQANIRHAPAEFEAGIRTHFRLKRRYLKQVFKAWFPKAVRVKSNSNMNDGDESIPRVSVDPTLQPLSQQIYSPPQIPFLSGGQYPTNLQPQVPTSMIGLAHAAGQFGHGRNFRTQKMTLANLQSITDDLDSLS